MSIGTDEAAAPRPKDERANAKRDPDPGPSSDRSPECELGRRSYFFFVPPLAAVFVGAAFAALLDGAGLAAMSFMPFS